MQSEEVLTTVLERRSYAERARGLRRSRASFSPDLVAGFVRHAHEVMRADPGKARQHARLGLYVARVLEDVSGRLQCLRALSQAAMLAGHYPEALRAVDRALALLGPRADLRASAEMETLRVQALTQLERYEEARTTGRRVLRAFEELGDERGIVRVRMALADLAIQVAHPKEALRHYREVQGLLPPTATPRFQAALAANRANALQACNRFRAAARWFEQARAIFAAEGCEHTVAQLDYNLAHSELLRGRYTDALRRYEAVEQDFERLGDDMHLGHIDLDRAEIHLLLSLPADARRFAQRAAERFEPLELEKDLAQAEVFAGRAAAMLGDFQDAVACYAAARGRFAALGLIAFEATCVVQQAYALHRLGFRARAERRAEEAAALICEDANPLTAASVALLRAHLHLAGGRAAPACHHARAALRLCRHVHAPWLHVEVRRVLGAALRGLGCDARAMERLREAVDILERFRVGVPPDEYMTAFLGARSDLYAQLLELQLESGDVAAAFETCERAKSRALLDLLARQEAQGEVEEVESPRVRFLREALNAAYWHLFRGGAGSDQAEDVGPGAVHREAAELEEELGALLRAESLGRGAGAAAVQAPGLAEIQARLGADTALLDYLVTPHALVTFLVTHDGIEAVRQELEPGEIERRLLRFRFHLSKQERPHVTAPDLVLRATRENLGALRERLLDPVAARLGARRLVVAPHADLHAVPFHALPWRDGWLADRFEVVTVPSAAVWLRCAGRTPRADGPAALFGVPDPRAPHIESEAIHLALLLGTPDLHLGADATFAQLRRSAPRAGILHVATHGMFRRENPRLSSIRLADRWVTLHDLYTLRIRGSLVVLSTCESGTAGVSSGNEIAGLTRGLLYAGAPALLCSQWRVRDGVAATFMQAFYEALRGDGDVAAAHRSAMARVRRKHPHPYFWAPFFLMGSPARAFARASLAEGLRSGGERGAPPPPTPQTEGNR
jgi:CHAT domain-containing protein